VTHTEGGKSGGEISAGATTFCHPSQDGVDSSASDPALLLMDLMLCPAAFIAATLWRSTITAGWAGIAAGYRTKDLPPDLRDGHLKTGLSQDID
jgi:hypothetical protein